MRRALPDVNVLIAVLDPGHQHHDVARAWFIKAADAGWATTPITETGTVRLVTNPAIIRAPLIPSEAVAAISALRSVGDHAFWADERPVGREGLDWTDVHTHRQVTDARLVAIAAVRQGTVATLDRGLARRYPVHSLLIGPAA